MKKPATIIPIVYSIQTLTTWVGFYCQKIISKELMSPPRGGIQFSYSDIQGIKLYLVSDDEIKSGDLVLLSSKEVRRMTENDMINYLNSESNATKKIIGTPEQLYYGNPDNEEMLVTLDTLNKIFDNGGKCFVEWEENQCDGCRARIPFNGHNNHQKPNDRTDPFGMGCTAYLYDRPKLVNGKISLYL